VVKETIKFCRYPSAFAAATISLPFGNNSLFSIFHSIDGRPGLVNRRPIAIDKYNKFISYSYAATSRKV
jgi:hypothetical protein